MSNCCAAIGARSSDGLRSTWLCSMAAAASAPGGDPPADPSIMLKPADTVVLDDFHPPMERWPPLGQSVGEDALGRDIDRALAYWFDHPDLLPTELRVHPMVSAVIGTRAERRLRRSPRARACARNLRGGSVE